MRATRRHAKPGQCLVYYGKLPGDSPGICYAWGDEGATKRHGGLLSYLFGGQRIRLVYGEEREKAGYPYIWDKSMLEELEAAGFDLTTLRFSIEMKRPEPTASGALPSSASPVNPASEVARPGEQEVDVSVLQGRNTR